MPRPMQAAPSLAIAVGLLLLAAAARAETKKSAEFLALYFDCIPGAAQCSPFDTSQTLNMGAGSVGSENTFAFFVQNTSESTLMFGQCSVSNSAFVLTDLPAPGEPDDTLGPGVSTGFSLLLQVSQPGSYSTQVSCYGGGAFNFGATVEILENQPTIQVLTNNNVLPNPGSFAFPSTMAGTIAQTFTVRNLGNNILNVGSITLSGGPGFAVAGSAPFLNVAAGASASFVVDFSPTNAGNYATPMTLSSNAANASDFQINLSGTATAAPAPQIEVTDTSGG